MNTDEKKVADPAVELEDVNAMKAAARRVPEDEIPLEQRKAEERVR
jgi:hypothetical protein